MRALELREARTGMTFSEMLDAEIDNSGLLPVMDRVAKFVERVNTTNLHHSGEVGLVGILESLAQSTGHHTDVESEPDSVRH